MDLYDDIFNDQSLQFSPLRLSPSPEPFTSIVGVLQDPLVEETENVREETVGLINNSAISEANPSRSAQCPDLIPLPDTLTLVQSPPEVQQDQQFLYNPHGSLQGNTNGQLDHQSLFSQKTMNHFQEPNDSAMQQDHNFGCNPHGLLQGNANGQLDQQSLFNQNTMNPFQELNDSTMIGVGQQIEEENNGYAHPVMTQSFGLPNHLQEQFSLPLSQSYPSNLRYQNGLIDSHSNIYDQQPPPLVQANREDEALVPRMVTEVTSRNQGNVQELLNKPSSGVKYPTLKDYAHLFPSTKAFAPIEFNVLWRQQENNPSRFESRHRNGQSRLFERNVFGRRQRNDSSGIEDVESSSAAQRRRTVSPKRNVDLTADDLGDKSLGLKIDPHLRVFFPPKRNVGRGPKENQRRQEPDERPPSTGKRDRRLI
ncbi:hypothetical protein IGI04_026638 [Brassica rapa subsp. trilocularis]|uniref:Uncharacterized protein n=1 Tax=Brassica rapa subsp. trilocularis TaxID=1813537 RepID=A0ABQ7KX53_BRACM|nr:hypothetical protein IGI04_026638 [Brassica rapa subsp. trilocularis]